MSQKLTPTYLYDFRMKRSGSGNLDDIHNEGEFRRGGVRATAGGRLGWSSSSNALRYEMLKIFFKSLWFALEFSYSNVIHLFTVHGLKFHLLSGIEKL